MALAGGMVLRAARTLLPHGLEDDVVVELDGDRIRAVRRPRRGDPDPTRGVLVPGLVNAHLHLELAGMSVPGGEGLLAWVRGLLATPRPDDAPLRVAAAAMAAAGTVLVCDVSNGAHTAPILAAAGLTGVVQHELLGLGREQWPARAEQAREPDRQVDGIVVRPSPHATYSTAPELIRAACRPGRFPATIHLSEDPHEVAFTERGEGPFASFCDGLGLDWRWWEPPGCTPTAYLDRLGVLGPGLLTVHGVWLTDDDRRLLRERGSSLVLCARSNLHIGGRLPDVPALLADGVRLCLGTDSSASCPDLDVLGEIPALAKAFPDVPVERWLRMATLDAADALGAPGHGRIAVGATPGLVLLEVDDLRDLATAVVPRRPVRPPVS